MASESIPADCNRSPNRNYRRAFGLAPPNPKRQVRLTPWIENEAPARVESIARRNNLEGDALPRQAGKSGRRSLRSRGSGDLDLQ